MGSYVRALVITATAAGVLALPAPAYAATTKTSTSVRACTNLADPSCAVWATIPAGIGVSMRCWQDESWYGGTNRWFWISGGGVQGFASASQIGVQTITPWCGNDSRIKAVRWAGRRLHESVYVGWCLAFVREAWLYGAGWNIGSAETAYKYWVANPRAFRRAYDTNPPVGALVFWTPDVYNSAGHVAISIGNGRVISTYERSTKPVHIFRIADRNTTKPYAGYLAL